MGCGCGRNKKRGMQSSRMPAVNAPPKKINNIRVPREMTPNQRRSTIAKINNAKINSTRKMTIADYVKKRQTGG